MTEQGEYKVKQIIIRMKWNTYLRIRRVFLGKRNESIANYFERLAKHLEEVKNVK
jgi:hypothetical protein